MFLNHRTQGFILKKENNGEANQILLVYTKDFGKIEVSAKAIRKLNSKLKSSAQVFYLSEIEFVQGKTQKTLTDASSIENFPGIRKDILKLRLAYNFSRVFCELVKNQEADKSLWQLLNDFFSELNLESLTSSKALLFYHFYFWNLLDLLGYRPELNICIFCRKKVIPPSIFWVVSEGGLVCHNCLGRVKIKTERIDAQTIKTLRLFLSQDWKTVRMLKTGPKLLEDLKVIAKNYFNHIHEQHR